jgi:hypothetical protein
MEINDKERVKIIKEISVDVVKNLVEFHQAETKLNQLKLESNDEFFFLQITTGAIFFIGIIKAMSVVFNCDINELYNEIYRELIIPLLKDESYEKRNTV